MWCNPIRSLLTQLLEQFAANFLEGWRAAFGQLRAVTLLDAIQTVVHLFGCGSTASAARTACLELVQQAASTCEQATQGVEQFGILPTCFGLVAQTAPRQGIVTSQTGGPWRGGTR